MSEKLEAALDQEERLAWDRYAAAVALGGMLKPHAAAEYADNLLVERRKRFGED